ncbi:IS66 family insertion sequence element accessory protein TnpA [Aneurinibacillus terranovensis]|uniref:IS66 family insertion sequence element accessory protein TnpA n=1 Tax=Aneurinibacillus terranovensis TaxID=278991 RepID=UPI003CCC1588
MRQAWEARVAAYRASGQRASEWCAAHQCTTRQLWYWLRTYCRNRWDKLEAFMKDGRLEVDNNRSERSIKPFVIGRKNWMFANTPRGAQASAMIYSIIETAKENGLNPFVYLSYLFEKLPNLIDTKDHSTLDKLLPWSQTLPLTYRVFNTKNT